MCEHCGLRVITRANRSCAVCWSGKYEPTTEELDAMIRERMSDLPDWWFNTRNDYERIRKPAGTKEGRKRTKKPKAKRKPLRYNNGIFKE